MAEKTYRNLIPTIVEREQATLPRGYDSWGVKSVHPDLMTSHGFRWPYPGTAAICDDDKIVRTNTGSCPSQDGDGLCVGLSWQGMASGGIAARTLLLVAYRADDVLGRNDRLGKLRASEVAVVALVDGERLLREAGNGADLYGADLRGANLYGADLRGANLSWADLRGADLYGADLRDADLSRAGLCYADLSEADLSGANLSDAKLPSADLYGWDITDGIATRKETA